MRDHLRSYPAIRNVVTQWYPGRRTGTVARHVTTLAALGRNEMDQLLKLVKRQACEIQERHRTGLQLGAPYTCHGSCLLSRSCDVRGASYQKESGINSLAYVGFCGMILLPMDRQGT